MRQGTLRVFSESDAAKSAKRVLLVQLDGKIPNIALMRIAAHFRERNVEVKLRRAGNEQTIKATRNLDYDAVYASLIFEKTRPLVEPLLEKFPNAILGGTGIDVTKRLEDVGIDTREQDYAIYPRFKQSIGFTQRGCRLKCSFCVVPRKEGAVAPDREITDIWRGAPYPRELLLLDNDFFGQPDWRRHVEALRADKFKVSFNQGINARFLDDETAEAIASVDYRDDSMRVKRIYTAWDSRKDEGRLFRGLEALVRAGVSPRHIMVYILIGYWPDETHEDRDYRRARLRDFGAMPYPMPYVRTKELVGFQRWVIGAYDKRVSWARWERAQYQPRNMWMADHPEMDLA